MGVLARFDIKKYSAMHRFSIIIIFDLIPSLVVSVSGCIHVKETCLWQPGSHHDRVRGEYRSKLSGENIHVR